MQRELKLLPPVYIEVSDVIVFYLWIIGNEENDHFFVEYWINYKDSLIHETHKIDSGKS